MEISDTSPLHIKMVINKLHSLINSLKFKSQTFVIFFVFFTILYCFLALVSVFFVRMYLSDNLSGQIDWLLERVKNDMRYTNGKWDISLYLSDPFTPYPAGNGGFGHPLYIITREGFVIERNLPINELLDSTSIKNILRFSQPKTISAITNEDWRVLSAPIKSNNVIVGALFIAQFKPVVENISTVDRRLESNIDKLKSSITITDGRIDSASLDSLQIDYDLSFEIIDKENRVLKSNGRVPTYIDPSFVSELIVEKPAKIIRDPVLKKDFLVKTKTLFDSNNQPIGIVVHGQSMDLIQNLIKNYSYFALVLYFLLIIPLSVFAYFFINYYSLFILNDSELPIINEIRFDKQKGKLTINKRSIDIPEDSNIYKMCNLLFSDPAKNWPQEVFFEIFDTTNWRSVYDSFLTINRKTNIRLILHHNKSYFINPDYIKHIVVNDIEEN